MLTVEDILKYKERYAGIDGIYQKTRTQQKEDNEYINDVFKVPEITEPHKVLRSGLGRLMVDAPAEQIVTSNPQLFVDVHKGAREAGIRLSEEANQRWISIIRRQNPNPFKEFVKNLLARGESYIKIVHNPLWVTGEGDHKGLPVLFVTLDPMVIYGSPEEDENGMPDRVIIFYNRQPEEVIVRYTDWTNPKQAGMKGNKRSIEWFEYWDKDVRYFEADGEAVLAGGVQENIYGFCPFIRKYSGFGRRSPDGELSSLVVSDIRYSRDLIRDECATRSNIASIHHLFAHRPVLIVSPGEINQEQIDNIDWGAYSTNIVSNAPVGTDIKFIDVAQPSPSMYQHLANIRAEINQRNPFIMAGLVLGTSGRHLDMATTAAMRRYDTVIENTEIAFATAFEKAFRICSIVPTMRPDSLHKGDLNVDFKCSMLLKAHDPVEADRLSTLGDRLWNGGNGSIDLRTNLIQYQGYTEDKAEDIIANILVDRLTLYNPDVAAIMGMEFAEQAGLERYLAKLHQRQQEAPPTPKGIMPPASPTEELRRKGEVKTQMGMEMAPESTRGARRPPEGY